MKNRYVLASSSEQIQTEEFKNYLKTHKDIDRVWLDLDKKQAFGYSTKMEIENQIPGAFNSGGWYSFHLSVNDWLQEAQSLYQTFFEPFPNFDKQISISDDLLYASQGSIKNIDGSKVLVVGGGPTTTEKMDLLLDIQDKYDIKATCNHFFLNEQLVKIKFDYVFLSQEVNLSDRRLLKYIEKNNPVVAFEHGPKSRLKQIHDFSTNCKSNILFYITRYFSRLGYTSRQVVFMGLNGATQVDFIGLDGFTSNKATHAFQKDKRAPNFYDTTKYHRLGIVFWDYLLQDKILSKVEFNNLSDDSRQCLFSNYKKMVTSGKVSA